MKWPITAEKLVSSFKMLINVHLKIYENYSSILPNIDELERPMVWWLECPPTVRKVAGSSLVRGRIFATGKLSVHPAVSG